MSFVLQIQEIVEGPLKDLYLAVNNAVPTLPSLNFTLPENVDLGSSFGDLNLGSTDFGSTGGDLNLGSTDFGSTGGDLNLGSSDLGSSDFGSTGGDLNLNAGALD